jgi:hypothetical protein
MAHILHFARNLIKYEEVARADLNRKTLVGWDLITVFLEVNAERPYGDCKSSNIRTITCEIGGKR